ncbi:MAG: cytosine permease [bacterium]
MQHSDHRPVPQEQRELQSADLLYIWFGAAIAISEIWGGGLPSLAGVGLAAGIIAILIGRLVGNGLMGAMAAIGAQSGLPTMLLTRPAFGVRGGVLPAVFNVLQLLGWTGWMLFVGFLYMDRLAGFIGLPVTEQQPAMKYLWILLLGGLCIVWAAGGQRFWQLAQRISAILLFVLSIAMTAIVILSNSLPDMSFSGIGPLRMLAAADVVIAMSVSWLPLVADYSRFAREPSGAARGTFLGYFIGGSWMYFVGLLVACSQGLSSYGDVTPDQMVIQTMGQAGLGWAVMAVVLVLLSTVTTTFLDIYSCVVSAQSLLPRIPDRIGNILTGLAGIGLACFLDVFAFEPFLLAIGAVFLPIFAVVLSEHYLIKRGGIDTEQIDKRSGIYWYMAGWNPAAVLAWLVGFLVYDRAGGWGSINYFLGLAGGSIEAEPFACGASLPCLAASVAAYLLLRRLLPGSQTDSNEV